MNVWKWNRQLKQRERMQMHCAQFFKAAAASVNSWERCRLLFATSCSFKREILSLSNFLPLCKWPRSCCRVDLDLFLHLLHQITSPGANIAISPGSWLLHLSQRRRWGSPRSPLQWTCLWPSRCSTVLCSGRLFKLLSLENLPKCFFGQPRFAIRQKWRSRNLWSSWKWGKNLDWRLVLQLDDKRMNRRRGVWRSPKAKLAKLAIADNHSVSRCCKPLFQRDLHI